MTQLGNLLHESVREHQSQRQLMKAQSSSWAETSDGRVQKGILSAQLHISIRACYRGGDPGTGGPSAHSHMASRRMGMGPSAFQEKAKGH